MRQDAPFWVLNDPECNNTTSNFFKKHLESIQSCEDVLFWGPKRPICSERKTSSETINININVTFIYLLAPFNVQNFKKILRVVTRVMRIGHFWVQNSPFAPKKNFLGKIFNIIFIYLLTPFIEHNFKIFHNGSRVMWMRNF